MRAKVAVCQVWVHASPHKKLQTHTQTAKKLELLSPEDLHETIVFPVPPYPRPDSQQEFTGGKPALSGGCQVLDQADGH